MSDPLVMAAASNLRRQSMHTLMLSIFTFFRLKGWPWLQGEHILLPIAPSGSRGRDIPRPANLLLSKRRQLLQSSMVGMVSNEAMAGSCEPPDDEGCPWLSIAAEFDCVRLQGQATSILYHVFLETVQASSPPQQLHRWRTYRPTVQNRRQWCLNYHDCRDNRTAACAA